jgi:hypothetical protein
MHIALRTAIRRAGVVVIVLLAGCATRSGDVQPRPGDPATYAGWDCDRLFDEIDLVQQRAAEVAYAVDARVGNNMIALGLGATVFWPALLAMRGDGPEAEQLAELKGRYDALRVAARRQSCGQMPEAMHAARVAALPIAIGDRLVYEDREGNSGASRELGLKVVALKRDQIEFRVDLQGKIQPTPWRQDLAGNPVLEPRPQLIGWQRLLHRDLELGQVLSGELAAADATMATARVRGQVVAIGPQTIAGHTFDVAVIELFGDAPMGEVSSTRLEGVMSVDRRSGVLLRMDLNCANADFSMRRRLMYVEPAAR